MPTSMSYRGTGEREKELRRRSIDFASPFSLRYEPMIISGGDDGVVKIWDLRQFKTLVKSFGSFVHSFAQ